MGKNFVEDAQVASPQFLLPVLRMRSLLLSTASQSIKDEGTHTVKGFPFSKIQRVTEDSQDRHFILLFIAFSLKDIFFLLHCNQQHYVSVFFPYVFFSFFGNLPQTVLFRMFCKKGTFAIYNTQNQKCLCDVNEFPRQNFI